MSVKCPGCGFDSPDDALFCDFCKEPFRKKKAAAPAQEKPVEHHPVVSELKKLPQEELLKRVPIELLKDKAGEEELPKFPPYVRYFAWAFLGVWFVVGMILGGIMLARYREREGQKDIQKTPQSGQIQIIEEK